MTEAKQTAKKKKGSAQKAFGAEIEQLLDIVIHAVYSDREVFLRELISNAVDAVEKLRFEALSNPELLPEGYMPLIEVVADKDEGKLTIRDNGIGMNHDELVENLGTIARSGTRRFLEKADKDDKASGLIGRFGIGFYAVFMVAKSVSVTTCRAGETKAWVWQSEGRSTYDLSEGVPSGDPGTSITIILRDDATEFAESFRLRHIIHAYSAHVAVPIDLVSGEERERVAEGRALWRQSRADISAEDYKAFYNDVAGLFDEPTATFHFAFEGMQQFYSLLFIPGQRPYDLFDPKRLSAIKLYVRRVFITDESPVLPGYLRFLRGVVDSDDLPLSVSRETLQKGSQLQAMRKSLTNRVLSECTKLAEDNPEEWHKIWDQFGAVIKEGLYEDHERREKLFGLARFRSTHGDGWRSLSDYVAAMKPEQTSIYYITGDSDEDLRTSPHIEGFLSRGIEVLLLSDTVDSFWVTAASDFDGKSFKSATQGGLDPLDLPGDNKPAESTSEEAKEDDVDLARLCSYAQTVLGDEVKTVRLSSRLATSPVCLVASSEGPDRNLARLLAHQPGGNLAGNAPIMEINPQHDLIRKLASVAEGEDRARAILSLFDMATLLEGDLPKDRRRLADSLYNFALKGLN